MGDRPSRILLVEDNPGDARLLREMLGDAGPGRFAVVHAVRLDDALGRLQREEVYDLLLLDLSLPDSQGLETVSRVQAAAPLVPIVVLTGLDDEALGLQAIRAGAQDYLVKGYTDTRLLAQAIDYATERKRHGVERERLLEELRRARDELEQRVQERTADLQRTVGLLQAEILARKQAEGARARLQEQLHQAQKMEAVGQLAAGLGHDFGNLLATVLGCASRAKDSPPDAPAVARMLEGIEDAARQAGGIVKSLLTFSCQAVTRRQPVNLCAVLAESAYLLRHTLPSSVELTSRACEPPLWVRADSVHMEQVLLNLAINARDAMPDGGQLEISVAPVGEADLAGLPHADRPEAGFALLVIRDTGTGIPPEIQRRMFDPYFTTKPRGQGTGLGLSIVHGIVHDLGGRIEVLSEAGQGTTFKILLPCIEPPASAPEEATPPLEIPQARGQVVLLAGGTPHVRGIIGAMLRLLGCDVEQADDQPAIEACYDEYRDRIRLIVIERGAFENGALDHVSGLRAAGIRTPVVVLCDETAGDLKDRLAPGVLLVHKPYGMPELRQILCEVLGVE